MVCVVAGQESERLCELIVTGACACRSTGLIIVNEDVMHTCQVKRCNRKVADKYLLCSQHGRQACNAARWHEMVNAAKRELSTS